MSTLEVTPSSLRTAAKVLGDAAAGIGEELDQLSDAADALRLVWEGDAQVAFDRSQTRLRAQMDLHGAQLIEIARAVAALADGYAQADRDAARGLGGQ